MNYPDDDNGDVLRRLEATGDDLTLPRNIDFIVAFPDENAAERFGIAFPRAGLQSFSGICRNGEGTSLGCGRRQTHATIPPGNRRL